jgi:hypothetical protein
MKYNNMVCCVNNKEWVSEWLLFNANSAIFAAISRQEQVNSQWDDDELRFVLDQHDAPLEHIILIPRLPVFALSPLCCMINVEATNTNFFGLTRLRIEPTIYRTRGKHLTITPPIIRYFLRSGKGEKYYIFELFNIGPL